MLAHLITLLSLPLPLLNLFGLLAVGLLYLVRGTRDPEFVYHARESLNFQFNVLAWLLLGTILGALSMGLLAFVCFLIMGFNVLATLVGAVRCANGERYRYPLILRVLR